MDDTALLQDYARTGSEPAFAALVERYVALVYCAALRQVREPHLAQDVTQAVFIILARKANRLTHHAVLSGWLLKTTRYAASMQIRAAARRCQREQEAYMQSTLNDPSPAVWEQLAPLLDEAMTALGETDRNVLALRFFENKSAQEIGRAMQMNEDAAQKRVTRAVEKLRKFFAQRGVTLTATAIAGAVSANSVQAVPAGLAAIISSNTLSGTTITAAVVAATKAIAMTTFQKTIITAALIATVGAGVFEANQAAHLRAQNQTLQKTQASLTAQIQQLSQSLADATNRMSSLLAESARSESNSNEAELLKLRGEVGVLRKVANNPADAAAKALVAKVNRLKQRLEERPDAKIPELQFLTEQDWLHAVSGNLNTDADYRRALSSLRGAAEYKFANMLQPALSQYVQANNKQFPTDLSQLVSFLGSPVDDAILQRWEIAPASTVPNIGVGGMMITEKTAVDDIFDTRIVIGADGSGSTDFLESEIGGTLKAVYAAFLSANPNGAPNGLSPGPSLLLPYATTPEQQAAVKKLMEQKALEQ